MKNSKIINAATEILSCAEIPFQLIVPDERFLKVFSNYRTAFADSVTCRFDSEADNNLRVSFNDEPQPELSEKTLKVGDKLKIRVHFYPDGLAIQEVADILSHTRTETSTITINLKE